MRSHPSYPRRGIRFPQIPGFLFPISEAEDSTTLRLESGYQTNPKGSRGAWRDVRIAVCIGEVFRVPEVLHIPLNAYVFRKRNVQGAVCTHVARQNHAIVHGHEHVRPAEQTDCSRNARVNEFFASPFGYSTVAVTDRPLFIFATTRAGHFSG